MLGSVGIVPTVVTLVCRCDPVLLWKGTSCCPCCVATWFLEVATLLSPAVLPVVLPTVGCRGLCDLSTVFTEQSAESSRLACGKVCAIAIARVRTSHSLGNNWLINSLFSCVMAYIPSWALDWDVGQLDSSTFIDANLDLVDLRVTNSGFWAASRE